MSNFSVDDDILLKRAKAAWQRSSNNNDKSETNTQQLSQLQSHTGALGEKLDIVSVLNDSFLKKLRHALTTPSLAARTLESLRGEGSRLQTRFDDAVSEIALSNTSDTIPTEIAGQIATLQTKIGEQARLYEQLRLKSPKPSLPSSNHYASYGTRREYQGFGSDDISALEEWRSSLDCDPDTLAESEKEAAQLRAALLMETAELRTFNGRNLNTYFREKYSENLSEVADFDGSSSSESSAALMKGVAGIDIGVLSRRKNQPSTNLTLPLLNREYCEKLLTAAQTIREYPLDLSAKLEFQPFLDACAVYLAPLLTKIAPNSAGEVIAGNIGWQGRRIAIERTTVIDSAYQPLEDKRGSVPSKRAIQVRVVLGHTRNRLISRLLAAFRDDEVGDATFSFVALGQTAHCLTTPATESRKFGDEIYELVMEFSPLNSFDFTSLPVETQRKILEYCDAIDLGCLTLVGGCVDSRLANDGKLWAQHLKLDFKIDWGNRLERRSQFQRVLLTIEASSTRSLIQYHQQFLETETSSARSLIHHQQFDSGKVLYLFCFRRKEERKLT